MKKIILFGLMFVLSIGLVSAADVYFDGVNNWVDGSLTVDSLNENLVVGSGTALGTLTTIDSNGLAANYLISPSGFDQQIVFRENTDNRWIIFNDQSSGNDFKLYNYQNTNNPMIIDGITSNVAFSDSGTYTGTWTDVSDERLKENFEPITYTLDKINSIQAYKFNMIGDTEVEYGFKAQEVLTHFPELTPTNTRYTYNEEGDIISSQEYYTMNYVAYTTVLHEGIKDLYYKNNQLENENQILENEIWIIKQKMCQWGEVEFC